MLFISRNPIPQAMQAAVVRAVQTVDAFAQVRVDASGQQIRIDGRLSAREARAAVQIAGCSVELADESAGPEHVPGGSTCCGGCS